MTSYVNILTVSVIFSDADESTIFNGGASLLRAQLGTNITSIDKNVKVDVIETLKQADESPATATVVATITTTDKDAVISTLPVVSNQSVQITSSATESQDGDNYITVVTSVFSVSDSTLHAYVESVSKDNKEAAPPSQYRYIVMPHNVIEPYLHGSAGLDDMMYCGDMYSMMNVSCVKIAEKMYQTLKHLWARVKLYEVDADTAFYGTTFFSEIRPIAKVWEAKTPWYGEKTPTEITPEIQAMIVRMMTVFAKEIIGQEFDSRFIALKDSTELEVASWDLQKHEAQEWLINQGANGSKTPFLDYLAEEHNIDKTTLSNNILANAEDYEDRLSTLLVQQQRIFKQFDACTTVWDINILYEDYLGVQMPIKQAIALGRTVSESDWERKDEWRLKGNGYYF